MYAVVNIGGKQAKVEQGSIIAVETLDAQVGDTVSLPVLMLADGERVLATSAELAGASVSAEVLEHFKGEKQIVFKFKKRKGYKRTKGHRQNLTNVKIVEISAEGGPVKAAEKPKAEKVAAVAKPKAEKAPTAEKPKVEKVAAVAKPKVEKVAAVAKPKAEKPKAAVEAEVATDQCAAIKSDGTRCTNKAKEGSKYCGVHAKKYEG